MKNYEVDKMVKKKIEKGIPAEQVGEANHIMRLVNTITAKIVNSYLNVEQRKTMNQLFSLIQERIKIMEDNDQEFQNLPENRIKSMQEELKANDTLLKKNKENYRIMVQVGLRGKGYPQDGIMYDTLIEDCEFDISELKMKIDSEYRMCNAQYDYQLDAKWQNLQLKKTEKQLKTKTKSLKEIKQMVSEVENDITAQNERMKNRGVQIIEELKKLGVKDISEEKKKTDYIG